PNTKPSTEQRSTQLLSPQPGNPVSNKPGAVQDRRGEELRLRAALETPMEALVAATKTNAEILGLSDEVGVIAPGMQADLVLWNGNPLEDPELFADPANAVLVLQAGRVVKDLR
ncbi:amidohydrolase family protein, partial [Nonomuraea sp. NPDC050643]|uniref:amidohydrolase family protein n=1 Tax=Nonomuraea sp. NPDC050643 TaxID=3155660 RepID=UPI0033CC6E3C